MWGGRLPLELAGLALHLLTAGQREWSPSDIWDSLMEGHLHLWALRDVGMMLGLGNKVTERAAGRSEGTRRGKQSFRAMEWALVGPGQGTWGLFSALVLVWPLSLYSVNWHSTHLRPGHRRPCWSRAPLSEHPPTPGASPEWPGPVPFLSVATEPHVGFLMGVGFIVLSGYTSVPPSLSCTRPSCPSLCLIESRA